MTSRGLTNAMKHNILFGLKSNKKVMILITIFHLLAFPLIIINCIWNCYSGYDTEPDDMYGVIAVMTTFAAGVSGIIIAMNNFRYLYNKSQVDMCLSQPMTRKQRFISDYLSGIMAYVLPFVAVSIITGLMLIFCLTAMEGQTFMMYGQYGERNEPEVCEFFSMLAPIVGYSIIVGILAMIMLFTLTLLVMVCCGTMFESILYTIMINAVIPISILLTFLICFGDLHGINCEDKALALIGMTSPAGAIVQLVYFIEGSPYVSYGDFSGVSMPVWLVGFIISTAAMLLGAYFLYMKRKAEQVSKPFVFRGFYYILITLMCLCLASFIGEAGGDFAALLIITFIFYMTIEVISRRGFKKIWHGILRYAATIAGLCIMLWVVDATGCFGMEARVPSASSVARVYIGYKGMDNNGISDDFDYFGGNEKKAQEALKSICLETPENIENVIGAHRELADYINEYDVNLSNSNFSICYILKNGTRMVRSYYSIPYKAVDYLKEIETSQEYKAQKAAYINEKVSGLYDYHEEKYRGETRREYYTSGNTISSTISFKIGYPGITEFKNQMYFPDKEFYTQLGAALENDIVNMPAEQVYRSNADSEFVLDLYYSTIAINSNYTETMALLSKYGYLYNVSDESLEESLRSIDPEHNYRMYIRMYTPEEYTSMFKETKTTVFGRINNYYIPNSHYVVYYSDELAELYKIMKPVYIADELCYTMEVDGRLYAIPNEYRETAQRLYSQTVTEHGNTMRSDCLYRGIAY